jgi:hypothetical protein
MITMAHGPRAARGIGWLPVPATGTGTHRASRNARDQTLCAVMGPCPRFTTHQGHWGQRPVSIPVVGFQPESPPRRGAVPCDCHGDWHPSGPSVSSEGKPTATGWVPVPDSRPARSIGDKKGS